MIGQKARGKMVNAFDPSVDSGLDDAALAMVRKRTQLLAPSYRLFYKKPVEVARARGTLLYDKEGNEYLDAYNNVVSVGHCHPHVVDAVFRQMQTLCTHTRYLQEGILKYAEDLMTTFEGRIGDAGRLIFTCTGSEANDLAIRTAKHYTGRKGIIVTSEAYHGNSELTAGFSPSLGVNSALGTWVRTVPSPDSYRIPKSELPNWFAQHVAAQIEDLQRHGEDIAAFVVDSLFSSDGIFSDPKELLGPVIDIVHRAGGLFVADEVQCGFARTGEQFWGHRRHGIDPDIITMGKPMGNGFPVAGIAVVNKVVEGFGHDVRYFNTFGGNTVAMAAAQSTLDVIRDENLQNNVKVVGAFLKKELCELARRHECIGDVRGTGLYIGVEIVADRQSKNPDGERASLLVNQLRERRVLISATGLHANTLKIRPPLVFSKSDATRLLEELDGALGNPPRTKFTA